MGDGVPERKLFRESAVREYLAGREKSVIPAFTGAKVTTWLWVFAAMIVAILLAFSQWVKVPEYQSTLVVVTAGGGQTMVAYPTSDSSRAPTELVVTREAESTPERWSVGRELDQNVSAETVAQKYGFPAPLISLVPATSYTVVSVGAETPVEAGAFPVLITSGERSIWELLIGAG